jgi:hypothetical protein
LLPAARPRRAPREEVNSSGAGVVAGTQTGSLRAVDRNGFFSERFYEFDLAAQAPAAVVIA